MLIVPNCKESYENIKGVMGEMTEQMSRLSTSGFKDMSNVLRTVVFFLKMDLNAFWEATGLNYTSDDDAVRNSRRSPNDPHVLMLFFASSAPAVT